MISGCLLKTCPQILWHVSHPKVELVSSLWIWASLSASLLLQTVWQSSAAEGFGGWPFPLQKPPPRCEEVQQPSGRATYCSPRPTPNQGPGRQLALASKHGSEKSLRVILAPRVWAPQLTPRGAETRGPTTTRPVQVHEKTQAVCAKSLGFGWFVTQQRVTRTSTLVQPNSFQLPSYAFHFNWPPTPRR